MKVRVFATNDKGKVEFTKDELEKLLNEVYQDGQNSMITIATPNTSPWWETVVTTPLTSPTIGTTDTPNDPLGDQLKITY